MTKTTHTDEPPETSGTDEPPETPPETPEESPAETTAHDEGEKVPAWGKTLIDQVEALTNAVTNSVHEPPVIDAPRIDENPSPKPWHLKGGK